MLERTGGIASSVAASIMLSCRLACSASNQAAFPSRRRQGAAWCPVTKPAVAASSSTAPITTSSRSAFCRPRRPDAGYVVKVRRDSGGELCMRFEVSGTGTIGGGRRRDLPHSMLLQTCPSSSYFIHLCHCGKQDRDGPESSMVGGHITSSISPVTVRIAVHQSSCLFPVSSMDFRTFR
jgi:hypothetical protein